MTWATAAGTAWLVVAIMGALLGAGAVIGSVWQAGGIGAISLPLVISMAFGLPILLAGGILAWKSADAALLASLYAFGLVVAGVLFVEPIPWIGVVIFAAIGAVSAMAAREMHRGGSA